MKLISVLSPMNLQPMLENERVCIRPLRATDREALQQAAADPLIWDQHNAQRYRPEVFTPFFEEHLASGGAVIIEDARTGELLGTSRYETLDYFPEGLEIGWTFFKRSVWGTGVNQEVKRLMLDHLLRHYRYAVFIVYSKNYRSQRAVEKIGGRRVDATEFPELFAGKSERVVFLVERKNA